MPEIQSPDPGRKLQERYGLIGTTPAPFLSPELVPVVIIDDLTEETPGVRFARCALNVVGVVGLQGQTALANPSSSSIALTNIRLTVSTVTGARQEVWLAGPALSDGRVEFWSDRRLSGSPEGVCTSGTDAGAVTQLLDAVWALANTPYVFDLKDIVLGPGDKLHFLNVVVNADFAFGWRWAERQLR